MKLALLAAICCLIPNLALAQTKTFDSVTLNTGSKIEGRVSEFEENGKKYVVIELDDGIKMKMRRSSVSQIRIASNQLSAYQAKLKSTKLDVAGHLKMAAWCKENLESSRSAMGRTLSPQREYHLRSIIRLDPNHEEAHRLLGHMMFEGNWVHRDHMPSQYGMVKVGSRWHTPEEISIREINERTDDRYGKWRSELKKQRSRSNRNSDYLNTLGSVNDRYAVPGLIDRFNREKNPSLLLTVLEAIGRQDSRRARNFLVKTAILHKSETVRERAGALLNDKKFSADLAASRAASYMMQAKDNLTVNRAAVLIGQLKSNAAILPLIKSLVTTHQIKIMPNQGNINANFNNGGLGGLNMGGGKPRIVKQTKKNGSVEEALRIITGKNFGFDEKAWINWYLSLHSAPVTNLNRDR